MGDTSKTGDKSVLKKKIEKRNSQKGSSSKCNKTFMKLLPGLVVLVAIYAYYEFRPSHMKSKELEQQVLKDLRTHFPGLGENGAPSVLQGKAKERGQKDLETVFLNVELSKHISYTRTLPDNRNSDCKRVKYDIDAMPTTTIVIIFYNEPFSVLMRTVHSILTTVDDKLLAEIVMVDDKSDDEELLDKLDYYIQTRLTAKVKLLRLKNR
jgi:polypeptide N-acetylgalactosaminyltransferase